MSMQIQLGPEAFRFTTFQQWVDKAQSWFAARIPAHAKAGRRYLCIDAVGRVCLIGKDFMRARDEQTFPIMVFLIDAEAPAGVTLVDGQTKTCQTLMDDESSANGLSATSGGTR